MEDRKDTGAVGGGVRGHTVEADTRLLACFRALPVVPHDSRAKDLSPPQQEAVRIILAQAERPRRADIARELHVSTTTLLKWIRKYHLEEPCEPER